MFVFCYRHVNCRVAKPWNERSSWYLLTLSSLFQHGEDFRVPDKSCRLWDKSQNKKWLVISIAPLVVKTDLFSSDCKIFVLNRKPKHILIITEIRVHERSTRAGRSRFPSREVIIFHDKTDLLIKKQECIAYIPVRNEVTNESFSGLLLLKMTTKVIRGSTRVKKYVLWTRWRDKKKTVHLRNYRRC